MTKKNVTIRVDKNTDDLIEVYQAELRLLGIKKTKEQIITGCIPIGIREMKK